MAVMNGSALMGKYWMSLHWWVIPVVKELWAAIHWAWPTLPKILHNHRKSTAPGRNRRKL